MWITLPCSSKSMILKLSIWNDIGDDILMVMFGLYFLQGMLAVIPSPLMGFHDSRLRKGKI